MPNTNYVDSGIVILPSNALPSKSIQPASDPTTHLSNLTFPPQHELPIQLYVLQTNSKPLSIVEVVRFSTNHGSWLLVPDESHAPHICSNGNMTIVTRVDPLFALLVLLDARRNISDGNEMFQPMQDLSVTPDGTDIAALCAAGQFQLLCDTKEAAGTTFYKLDEEKVLKWLKSKYDATACLDSVSEQDALDIVSQYITPKWTERLRKVTVGQAEEQQAALRSAQEMALSVMMSSARETNEANRIDELNVPQEKKAKAKPKKPVQKVQKKPTRESEWWANRTRSASSKAKTPDSTGKKRTRATK